MNIHRRRFLQLATSAAGLPLLSHTVFAQNYPARPVRLIVGFPAGGAADTVSRIIGDWLSRRLGQQVIIDNRPGAGSALSVVAVTKEPPDGYSILYYGASALVNKVLHPSHPYDLVRDIAPVAGLVDFPMVLVVHPSVPVRSVGELIGYAKANPGKLNMASFGVGTSSHLAGESFKIMADINMMHVPFSGGAPMAMGMVGGHVQVAFDVITTSLPHIRSGALRPLGVLGRQRLDILPGVPSVSETLPDYEAATWAGIGVSKGTPQEIIALLNREINAGLRDSATRSRMEAEGAIPLIMSPDQYGAFVKAEIEKWAHVVKVAGIKPE